MKLKEAVQKSVNKPHVFESYLKRLNTPSFVYGKTTELKRSLYIGAFSLAMLISTMSLPPAQAQSLPSNQTPVVQQQDPFSKPSSSIDGPIYKIMEKLEVATNKLISTEYIGGLPSGFTINTGKVKVTYFTVPGAGIWVYDAKPDHVKFMVGEIGMRMLVEAQRGGDVVITAKNLDNGKVFRTRYLSDYSVESVSKYDSMVEDWYPQVLNGSVFKLINESNIWWFFGDAQKVVKARDISPSVDEDKIWKLYPLYAVKIQKEGIEALGIVRVVNFKRAIMVYVERNAVTKENVKTIVQVIEPLNDEFTAGVPYTHKGNKVLDLIGKPVQLSENEKVTYVYGFTFDPTDKDNKVKTITYSIYNPKKESYDGIKIVSTPR